MMKKFFYTDVFNSPKFRFSIQKTKFTDNHNHEGKQHTHEFSELVIVLSGTARHMVGKEDYFVKAGDIYVLNRGIPHCFQNAKDLEIYYIMYDPHQLLRSGEDLKKLPGYQALFIIEPFHRQKFHFKGNLQLSMRQRQEVIRMIEEMENEYVLKADGYKSLLQAYFMQFVVYLSRRYHENVPETSKNILHLANAITHIEKNFLEQITLSDLAAKAFLSPRQFIRSFKQIYRVTPIDYIIQLRIQQGCRLMEKKNLSITEIAFESGFSDSNYFSRQFKRVVGFSPRDYRKKIEENL